MVGGAEGKPRPGDVCVSSTKGAVGHLLGAAGAAEALFSVMAIREVSCGEFCGCPPTLFAGLAVFGVYADVAFAWWVMLERGASDVEPDGY